MSDIPIRELAQEHLPRSFREGSSTPKGEGFGETLKRMVGEVNELQQQAGDSVKALQRGELEDLHQVMIQFGKAEIGFKFMMEVRNRLVEAYQEVSRMGG